MYTLTQSQISTGFKKGVWKISTAETKIMIVLCYYALFCIVALSDITIEIGERENTTTAITQYFLCEAVGSGVECDRSGFDHFGYHGLAVLVYLLLGLIPVINLIFVINWSATKESVKRVKKGYFQRAFSTQSSFFSSKQTPSTTETVV